ncbi:MAG: hypothetical protein GX592_06980 [Clostridiales bacterium]|nr:hypothetical protein [Clostridiales bacterium]
MAKAPLYTIKEIHGACREMGLAPLALGTPEAFRERYRGYRWYKIPFWRVQWVLYSVPAEEDMLEKPWESFYIEPTGEEKHHIHYAYRVHDDDREWIQPTPTEERPDEIIGRLWYWFDPDSMIPALLAEGRENA